MNNKSDLTNIKQNIINLNIIILKLPSNIKVDYNLNAKLYTKSSNILKN